MTKALLATVVLLALTGAACGGGGGSDCTSENATELTGTLTVQGSLAASALFTHGGSGNFSPNCFSAASGSTVSISNEDVRAHTFTVTDTDIDVQLPGGETGQATAPAPGTYDFLCTFHPGMTGTIIAT